MVAMLYNQLMKKL